MATSNLRARHPSAPIVNRACDECGTPFERLKRELRARSKAFYCSHRCALIAAGRHRRTAGSITERLWRHADKTPGHGPQGTCWVWTAWINKDGYGSIKSNRKTALAHRIAYFLSTGIEPGPLEVCHHCDNPPCVNPDHLFLGTRLENAQDAVSKGRTPKGLKNGRYTHPETSARGERVNTAVLTAANVQDILISLGKGAGLTELGRKYGVCKQAIYGIREGITWKHVPRP